MDKKFALQVVGLTLVTFLALGVMYIPNLSTSLGLPNFSLLLPTSRFSQTRLAVFGNDPNVASPSAKVIFKIEIADTKGKRSEGLGGRESLATDSGMLFVFEKADKYKFWMKGMKIPLDFVWIKGGSVVDVLQNIQPPSPGTKDQDLLLYQPVTEADKVLEVNAGVTSRYNIQVGDTIKVVQGN